MTEQPVCDLCGSHDIVRDSITGEIICTNCGLVLGESRLTQEFKVEDFQPDQLVGAVWKSRKPKTDPWDGLEGVSRGNWKFPENPYNYVTENTQWRSWYWRNVVSKKEKQLPKRRTGRYSENPYDYLTEPNEWRKWYRTHKNRKPRFRKYSESLEQFMERFRHA